MLGLLALRHAAAQQAGAAASVAARIKLLALPAPMTPHTAAAHTLARASSHASASCSSSLHSWAASGPCGAPLLGARRQRPHTAVQPVPLAAGPQARALHLAPPFLVEDYVPVGVTTYRLGRMKAKVEAALKELEDCRACPRNCGVNRLQGQLGMCNVGRHATVATVAPHFGEEAVLQGWNGSGTIFFSMCNLRCVFCQNWDISHHRKGFELTAEEMADWMMKLQEEGPVHNINLVTPEHMVPQVVEALSFALEKGLNIPVVYNTSGYDSVESIRLLDGLVDIYMPDFKFWQPDSAGKYAKARDYPERAREAIQEMHRQVGDLVFSSDGLAQRGLLLRHLVMPGLLEEGREIMRWTAQTLGRDTFVNIMEQYHPNHLVGKGERRSRLGYQAYDKIGARPETLVVQDLVQYARSQGLWRFEETPRYEHAGAQPPTGELAA